MKIGDTYYFVWNDASKSKPDENKNVISFHNGCECVSYVKGGNWYTLLGGHFEAEIFVSFWREIEDE